MKNNEFLRRLCNSGPYALGVGVHNALTAKLAEQAGFDLVWLSSLEVSTSKLLPDINIVTLVEMAEILREIRRATALPILVDGDNGYGSNCSARRAAEEFAAAGATAICMEDNAFPKRNSFYAGIDRQLQEPEEFARRIEVVVDVLGKRTAFIARTEGLIAGEGVEATVHRVRSYIAAGADAIFVQTNKSTLDQFSLVMKEVAQLAPIVITPTALPDRSAEELHALGADVIIHSNVTMRAIVMALSQVLRDLKATPSLDTVASRIVSMERVFELTKAQDWLDTDKP